MEALTNMINIDNEKFLTILLDKTMQKLNLTNNQILVLETQLKFANDKIKELEAKNDSSIEQTNIN
jgi:hypothetical protein